MTISDAIEILQRIKARHGGNHHVWLVGKNGWEQVTRIGECCEPEDGDTIKTAAFIGESAFADELLGVDYDCHPENA